MNQNQFEATVLQRLDMIERMLALLAEDKLEELRVYVAERYLTTDARKRMWQLMDGSRSQTDVANAAGVKEGTVRGFLADLLEDPRGLVEVRENGVSRYPKRLID